MAGGFEYYGRCCWRGKLTHRRAAMGVSTPQVELVACFDKAEHQPVVSDGSLRPEMYLAARNVMVRSTNP